VYRHVESNIQILLIKQFANDNAWGIPKGRMEEGETYAETAIRETFEETGIDIKIITQLPYVVITRKNYKKIVIPFLAIQICKNEPNSNHDNSEVVDARWFDVKNLPPIYSYQRPIFDAALLMLEMKNG
jgi:8-oxo-dGTP pyrophosphatase MutT (NUDIX family)